MHAKSENRMGRPLKAKKLANITVTRDGSTYWIESEDEVGKRALLEVTSDQALRLADTLDQLLAKEEEEQRPTRPSAAPASTGQGRSGDATLGAYERETSGTVKWYNPTKGFGFVVADNTGDELFLHRSVLDRAGMGNPVEGTRVRVTIIEGKKGPQVSTLVLV
jgi:cold shock CspA family protein